MFKKKLAVYTGGDENFKRKWGIVFEVKKKDGNFFQVISIEEPQYGICGLIMEKYLTFI